MYLVPLDRIVARWQHSQLQVFHHQYSWVECDNRRTLYQDDCLRTTSSHHSSPMASVTMSVGAGYILSGNTSMCWGIGKKLGSSDAVNTYLVPLCAHQYQHWKIRCYGACMDAWWWSYSTKLRGDVPRYSFDSFGSHANATSSKSYHIKQPMIITLRIMIMHMTSDSTCADGRSNPLKRMTFFWNINSNMRARLVVQKLISDALLRYWSLDGVIIMGSGLLLMVPTLTSLNCGSSYGTAAVLVPAVAI